METLTDNLARARCLPEAASFRDQGADGKGRTLFGHFSVFNSWYEVDSVFEGNFMERVAPGSFARTLSERGNQIKALYDHGHDPQLGNKPLGPFSVLREDNRGGYYEIDLIDTSYNRDFVIPAAKAGLLGASFRFRVVNEQWNDKPARSAHNPNGIPERTITDTNVYELGPVTFPASPSATAAVRSTTDEFAQRLQDPAFHGRFVARHGRTVTDRVIETLEPSGVAAARSRLLYAQARRFSADG